MTDSEILNRCAKIISDYIVRATDTNTVTDTDKQAVAHMYSLLVHHGLRGKAMRMDSGFIVDD